MNDHSADTARGSEPVNLLFGPPSDPDDCVRMLSLFFSTEGRHIVCGGTTAGIAAGYLGRPLTASLCYAESDIPPTGRIDGVDLVTEGEITMRRVVEYARDRLNGSMLHAQWSSRQDGASMICRMLFEGTGEIRLFVGLAVNPAHQSPELSAGISVRKCLAEELSDCLRQMDRRVTVSFF